MKSLAGGPIFGISELPKLRELVTSGLILTCMFSISYLFGLSREFLWSDDYSAYFNPPNTAEHSLRDLRPIHALITLVLFGSLNSSSDVAIIRYLGLLVLISISILAYCLLRSTVPPAQALFIAYAIGHSPAIYSSVYWAMGVTSSIFALFFGVFGFLYWINGRWVLGVSVLALAFAIYPLAALASAAIPLLIFIINDNTVREFFELLKNLALAFFATAVVSISFSYLILKSFKLAPNERVRIIDDWDPVETLTWFITRTLPQAFRPYLVSSPSHFTASSQVVLLIVLFIFMLRLQFPTRICISKFLQVIFSVIFLLAPLPLSNYNQVEPRFFIGPSILIIGLFCFLLSRQIGRKINSTFVQRQSVLSILALFTILISNVYFFNSKIRPIYENTQNFISQQLKSCSFSQISQGVYVVDRVDPWPKRPLLGSYSQDTDLASNWVPRDAIQLFILEELSIATKISKYETIPSIRRASFCRVDLNDFESI